MKPIHKNLNLVIFLFFVLFSLAVPVYAAYEGGLIIHDVEAIVNEDGNTYTVRVLLSALDDDMKPIEGLDERDFEVSEDSESVEIDRVSLLRDNEPINIIVAMDSSGSMISENRIFTAQSAISIFIKSFYRGDRIGVYYFKTDVTEVVRLTDDLNEAQSSFDAEEITPAGETCLYDAIYEMVQIAQDLPEERRAVIILTDGEDTTADQCSETTIDDIIETATQDESEVPIYIIGVGNALDTESLTTIAEETGGIYTESSSGTDLGDVFEQLANRLTSEYELVYTSENTPGGHELKVRLDNLSDEIQFDLPGLPPVILFTSPSEGETLEPRVIEVAVNVVERGVPVESLTFKINDVSIGGGGAFEQESQAFDIDFSQYRGQEVELTVVAVDKNGNPISQESVQIAFSEEVTATSTPKIGVEPTETTGGTDPSECPEGFLCLFNRQIKMSTLLLYGAIFLAVVGVAIILVVFLSKKNKKGKSTESPDLGMGDSLSEGATFDGFALPGIQYGQLTILSSDDPLLVGKEFQLVQSPTTIGRSVSNDIPMPKDSAVSRQHIEIVDENGIVMMREVMKALSDGTMQPPTYGTYLNDRKITGPTSLHNGDEISLGRRTKLRFEGTGQPAADGSSEDVTMDQISLQGFDDIDDATRDG